MANRYWVGGTANWDGTAGTKWAETSGGPGGFSVPTSADDVFFDAASGTNTVTISVTANCLSLNFTNFTGTITGTGTIQPYGSLTLSSTVTWNHTGNVNFNASSGSWTITSAGKTFGASVTVGANGGATWTLQDNFVATGDFSVNQGTFNTNNYNLTANSFQTSTSNTRTLNFGSSTITLLANGAFNASVFTNLTINAGTSTIILASPDGGQFVFGASADAPGTFTFYNVKTTGTSVNGTKTFRGILTFNNLEIAGPSTPNVTIVNFQNRCTINGVLSTTGTAGNRRVWFRGATYGLAQTLTVNATPSLTDADFRDLYIVGTAAPISGTRIGNLRGCSGITFSTPKTVYWNLAGAQNWSANGWSDTSTGTPSTDFFPLAQDTATFTNAGSVTGVITFDAAVPYTGTVDMSGRTSAATFVNATNFTIYGNWIFGSGITLNAGATFLFSGRNTQTITSSGKTFNSPFNVDTYGGTVELADALNIGTNTLTVTNGTFDTKNFSVTAGGLSSTGSTVRTITLGSSTVTLSGTSAVTFSSATNLTLNSGTSTINITSSIGNLIAASVTGENLIFYNVIFSSTTASGAYGISGQSTFNNLSIAAPAATSISQMGFAASQTINGTLTVSGANAVQRIFLRSNTSGAIVPITLTVGTLSATDCDFRDITIAGAAAGSSPTRAGDCGGNSGITFPAPKTVYWNLAGAQNWSATAWAPTSGGTPDINNFPLAQDTAVFDNTGSVTGTITINQAWNIGTFDASARTSAMTLALSAVDPFIYGDWKFGTGVTSSATTQFLQFSKVGTQTITSNGVSFGCRLVVVRASTTVQLADALSLSSTNYLRVSFGTFDAVSYNYTAGIFEFSSSNSRTIKMGSGTWTLSGTGTVWDATTTTNLAFYKGTANIVLSDTSTSARTFNGGGLSYNKLTIGGTTGISTTTITGDNQFTELASTKTVAHTIALGSTTQTFGKWTVTGTVGNVVTLTGTGTSHILAGACTSGIDYLAMGSIGFAATSPGEFYAGANSTGTAGAPVYRTAKPADSTRYWVGGTGNWSDTARWSTGSGGASGASVPRSHDDVVFDAASNATAYTATVDAVTGGIRMKSLTIAGPASGNVTLAGSVAMDGIHGNVTLPATGLTRTYTGAITLSGSTTGRTFTTNGVALNTAQFDINGVDCEWSLGSALNIGSSNLFVVNGTLNLATYNLTCGNLQSNYAHSRTINLSSGTITISAGTPIQLGTSETNRANLTFTAGTSQITSTNNTATLSGNNQTFYNVSFTSTSAGTVTINGTNSFNNLSFTGITAAGLKVISLTANQTVTGTLTFSAGTDATMRHFCQSNTIGTTRTITAAAVSMTDVDFRDITIAGAAAPASGTRIGDCKGNSGITFTAAANKYWNLAAGGNWGGAIGWATSSGGTPAINNFPLAQDTCIFEATGLNSGATVTINASYNIGTIDMSARTTNTMTLTSSADYQVHGNFINGTGTTLSGTNIVTFTGRGSQTITSAGKNFTGAPDINSPSGTVTLQDALTLPATNLTITRGTFSAASYNVTVSTGLVGSSNTNTRTVDIGSGTWTIISASGWATSTSTNLTVTGTGIIKLTSASAKSFQGGGIAYTNITLDQGGAGTLTITGNNTFKDITNTYKATGATTIAFGSTTQRVSQLTSSGELGRILTLFGSQANIVVTGATGARITHSTPTSLRFYSTGNSYAESSTNEGSFGILYEGFPVTVVPIIKTPKAFSAFFA